MKITQSVRGAHGLAEQLLVGWETPNMILRQKSRLNTATVSVSGPAELIRRIHIVVENGIICVRTKGGWNNTPPDITWQTAGRRSNPYTSSHDRGSRLTIRLNLPATAKIIEAWL